MVIIFFVVIITGIFSCITYNQVLLNTWRFIMLTYYSWNDYVDMMHVKDYSSHFRIRSKLPTLAVLYLLLLVTGLTCNIIFLNWLLSD